MTLIFRIIIGPNRNREMLPVNQILTNSMTPMHKSPFEPIRIILIEKVVFPPVKHKSVRVIHPVFLGRKVVLGPVFFIVIFRHLFFRIVGESKVKNYQNQK